MSSTSKNKKLALIGIVALIIIAIVAVAGGFPGAGNSSVIENPSIPTVTITPTPTATTATSNTVYDAIYVQRLLDDSWQSVVENPDYIGAVESTINTALKIGKYDQMIWNSKDFQVFYPECNPDKILAYGFADNIPDNTFYAGPIVLWSQEEPGGEINYAYGSGVWFADGSMGWKKEPYRYGIVTYDNPPKEIIEIFEKTGKTLIY